MSQDYNQTLNLPKTDFPMRAGLPQKEPQTLSHWEDISLYDEMIAKNVGKERFVLHDGPPYANGDIHTGHALNRVLKDFIVRYHNMNGQQSPYVPGWDTHGLPIETQVIKHLGDKRAETGVLEYRRICREFAEKYVNLQMDQLKRIGIMADWKHPYITYQPEYEAVQIKVFGEMAKKGYIYKSLKPVYWCAHDETALAEAEIEYADDQCDSIFVKMRVADDKGLFVPYTGGLDNVYFVIWTTTTWTLPGNVAIALGPDIDYTLARCGEDWYVIASELIESVRAACDLGEPTPAATFKGAQLERMVARHPFLDRDSLVIVGDHVGLDAGTGCVHTAPGHGVEDFLVCKNYPELPIPVPVDDKGRMTVEAGDSAGQDTDTANKTILAGLKAAGLLLGVRRITHQYPHCWRCKHPILFRATEQWFCSVRDFTPAALEAIRGVNWLPGWGEERLSSMVADRGDWCVSRQRTWGVPIPIFYCQSCNEPLINDDTINRVSDLFRAEGSDGWYRHDATDILGGAPKCSKCGGASFRKETDIMDVWFDSGSSHASVLEQRDYLHYPADLYIEGNDQFRGWFQSSLLTAVATGRGAPYKTVIACGMVVDGEGKKMSKSLGNGIDPMEVAQQYGADILRLWVSSADYTNDVRLSKEILTQLSEAYRKIRNTARFILGNIAGFNPGRDAVAPGDMPEIDRWALTRLNRLIERVNRAYDEYEFHMIYHTVHNFCVTDMSNLYLDVIKDRLYVEPRDSTARRSAQTVMYNVLDALTRMLAPILCFTAEEIWGCMPHTGGDDVRSVFLNEVRRPVPEWEDDALALKWDRLLLLRDDAKKALELARADKAIGSSLEAAVTLHCDAEAFAFADAARALLPALFIASAVDVLPDGAGAGYTGEMFPGVSISIATAQGEKCPRCWVISPTVGQNDAHPELCARCAGVMQAMK